MRIAQAVVLVLIGGRSFLKADEWPVPPITQRAAIAIDGSAKLVEFSPGQGRLLFPELATAARAMKVYTRSGDGSETLVWQADLTNYPVQLYVAPGGATVVTMDRWGSVGSDALVFYGDHGRVVKRYAQAEGVLITRDEAKWVEKSVSSFWWNKGAHAQFTADGQYFWVWLPWGRVMVFEVTTGNAVEAESLRLDKDRGRGNVLRTAEIMAESASAAERSAAARLAGWLSGQGVLPILRKLLLDPYYQDDGRQTHEDDKFGRFGDNWFRLIMRQYPVRRAAAEELHIKFGHADGAVEEWVAR